MVTGFNVTSETLTWGDSAIHYVSYAERLKLEEIQMNTLFLKMLVKLNDLTTREEGQDLVEYA